MPVVVVVVVAVMVVMVAAVSIISSPILRKEPRHGHFKYGRFTGTGRSTDNDVVVRVGHFTCQFRLHVIEGIEFGRLPDSMNWIRKDFRNWNLVASVDGSILNCHAMKNGIRCRMVLMMASWRLIERVMHLRRTIQQLATGDVVGVTSVAAVVVVVVFGLVIVGGIGIVVSCSGRFIIVGHRDVVVDDGRRQDISTSTSAMRAITLLGSIGNGWSFSPVG